MKKKETRRVKVTYFEATEEDKEDVTKNLFNFVVLLTFLWIGYNYDKYILIFIASCLVFLMIVILILEFVFGRKVMWVNVK